MGILRPVPNLFDDFLRTDLRPQDRGETWWQFYNRTDDPVLSQWRDQLSEWVAAYPATERAEMLTRLRLGEKSGLWELYLFTLFAKQGYSVELHPEIPGTAKHPDFLLSRGDLQSTVCVEAILTSNSQETPAAQRRRDSVLNQIERVTTSDFSLSVAFIRTDDNQPQGKRFRTQIDAWIKKLDVDAVSGGGPPAEIFAIDGWAINVKAFARQPHARGQREKSIGMLPGRAGAPMNEQSIYSALSAKGSRYGELGMPFVVAVCCDSWAPASGSHGFEEKQALYGDHFPQRLTTPGMGTINTKGYFIAGQAPDHVGVSAALIAWDPSPMSVTRSVKPPTVWRNPWAAHPLTDTFQLEAVDYSQSFEQRAGTPIHQIFELAPGWPPGEPFSGQRTSRLPTAED